MSGLLLLTVLVLLLLMGLSYDLLRLGGGGGFVFFSCLGPRVDLTDSFHSMLELGSELSRELLPLSLLRL